MTTETRPPKRLVIKVGSSTVVSDAMGPLLDQICALIDAGYEVALVSSGAVATGMEALGLANRPEKISRIQALAACGQAKLMTRYNALLSKHNRCAAQVLLTHEGLSNRMGFLNIRHTFESAFAYGLLPVVNENDSVAVEELRFGDNDRLAAAVSAVIDADLLIILSDIDALYDKDPSSDASAQPISEITQIDGTLRAAAGDAGSAIGTGGMATKVDAAEFAMEAGIPAIIASGATPNILSSIVAGEAVGTRFVPPEQRVDRRRHWIRFLSKLSGSVQVDAGAVRALEKNSSSLLPVGVRSVRGSFARGDAISVEDLEGVEVARGLVGYDSEDLAKICGHQTGDAKDILGTGGADPVLHRNDLILMRVAHGGRATLEPL